MSFCSKCGTQLNADARFCSACGTPVNSQPVQPQMQFQQPVYVYAQPKIPGRGLGIAGMILGIIGLVYGFIMMIGAISTLETSVMNDYESVGINLGLVFMILLYSSLSIIGVSLAGCGRHKGYRTGVSTAGVVTGIIGIVFYVLAIVVCLVA